MVAAAAAEVMGEGDVVALVSNEADALVVVEVSEPGGVDGEADAVGPGGAGGGVLDALEAEGEGGEEGMAQDEARQGSLQWVGLVTGWETTSGRSSSWASCLTIAVLPTPGRRRGAPGGWRGRRGGGSPGRRRGS